VISAILIDLDDTLLANDMKRFLPVYLDRLGAHLSNIAPADQIASQVMAGSMAMVQNRDPTRTLQQVFADHFFTHFGIEENDISIQVDRFYRDVFPDLQSLTAPIPGADQLIQTAGEKGIEIVIATSPLFPLAAIEHRLAWAGISSKNHSYSLISSYETFHFAKPHLEYYAEILAHLGYPPHQAAMIGNDPTDDLVPAQSLGLAVFDVTGESPELPGGDLLAAADWLDRAHAEVRNDAVHQPEVILARMRGHLAALHTSLPDLDEDSWTRSPNKKHWSINQTLCHLRDVEHEVYLPRIRTLLNEDNPHISAIDTDRWAEERSYIQESGKEAFKDFSKSRLQLIDQLDNLTPEEWKRPARHALLGPTTLAEIFKIATEHDLLHLSQIRASIESIQTQ
jgi:FMN phosphatase YigB (HAD superfamily)